MLYFCFIFALKRVTSLLGYQTSELLKKSLSDFLIPQDQQLVKEQLKTIFDTKQTQPVQMTLHFVTANPTPATPQTQQNSDANNIVAFKTSAYAFCNPCNESFEFIVCTHVNQSRLNEIHSSSNNNSTNTSSLHASNSQTNAIHLNPLSSTSQHASNAANSSLSMDYAQQYHLNYYNSMNGNGTSNAYQFQQQQQQQHQQPQLVYGGNYLMMQSMLIFEILP